MPGSARLIRPAPPPRPSALLMPGSSKSEAGEPGPRDAERGRHAATGEPVVEEIGHAAVAPAGLIGQLGPEVSRVDGRVLVQFEL